MTRMAVLALGVWAVLTTAGWAEEHGAPAPPPPAPVPSHPGCSGPGCAGPAAGAPCTECHGRPRFGYLRLALQWVDSCRDRRCGSCSPCGCCACGKEGEPCCYPPLYTFFLHRCAACRHHYPDHPHPPAKHGHRAWPPAYVTRPGAESIGIYEDVEEDVPGRRRY